MLYLYYKNANTKILPEEIIGHIYSFLPMNTKEVLENDDLMHYIRSFNSCELCSNQMSKNNTTVCSDCYPDVYEDDEIAWYYGSEI
mgnify:FL=1